MGDGSQHEYSTAASSHQQQELVGLLATAFPGGGGSESGAGAIADEASRVAALVSVHRIVLRPHAALHLRRVSFRISQSLHPLLFDKSYAVRQAAVVAYGAWGAVAATVNSSSNVRPAGGMPGGPAEQFVGWALPQLAKASLDNDTAVIALTGLKEFLTVGDPMALERFAIPALRACQSLLEDVGTSMTLLRPLLGVLGVLGFRFSRCVQPHFADMVDLLLGWALESDVSEVDSRIITGSFVRFQNLWVGSLVFSVNLLTKFLGDMEALAQDANPSTPEQLRRLMALAFCFVAVLQALTAGVLEPEKAELMTASSLEMLPRLTACLETVGKKFGHFSWTVVASRCLTLFADFLKEKFANHYSTSLRVLFQNVIPELNSEDLQYAMVVELNGTTGLPLQAQQVHSILLVNLQLLSSQGLALPVSSVRELLKWGSILSSLRLQPSSLVTSVVGTTYLFLLQHGSEMVTSEASKCLMDELEGLKTFLYRSLIEDLESSRSAVGKWISEAEAIALIKYDLSALVDSICCRTAVSVKYSTETMSTSEADHLVARALDLKRFIEEKLLPFQDPIQWYPNLQLAVIQSLHRLCITTLSTRISQQYATEKNHELVGMNLLNEYLEVIMPSLESYASLPLILAALTWVSQLCEAVAKQREQIMSLGMKVPENRGLNCTFFTTLQAAASHREPSVRGRVAAVLEDLLRAKMVGVTQMEPAAVVALEQLGDPDPHLQASFRRVLVACAPAALWTLGSVDVDLRTSISASWKQKYPGRHSAEQLRAQQLVTILNYISQRSQSLPSNWLQRLVHNCPSNSKSSTTSEDDDRGTRIEYPGGDLMQDYRPDDTGFDTDFLKKAGESNNLAAGWWAIQIAARHFITVRLRTHLGGPTQTFAVLERMLVDAAQLFQTESGQRDNLSTVNSSAIQLLPMRLLLEFMSFLEKNTYNAYEGSVVLSDAPEQSALFFRANKKVCEEWFVRIRDALLNLSIAIQCHSGTVHHASLRLHDLTVVAASALRESTRSQSSESQPALKLKVRQDVYRVLRHASLALCKGHDMDALTGLQVWTAASFGALLAEDSNLLHKTTGPISWMTGLGLQAQGQYERATVHYSQLLQSEEALGAMGADGVQFTIARMIESYVALSDWESLDSWLQDLQLLRAKHAGKAYSGALTTAGNDMNAIHALARFDAGDVSGAWGYLDLTPQKSNELTADPRQALQRSEQMLLQAMLRPRHSEDALRDAATAKAILEGVLLVKALNSLPDASPFVIHLECIRTFEAINSLPRGQEEKFAHGVQGLLQGSALSDVLSIPLDTYQQDCQSWLKLFRVYHSMLPFSPQTLRLQQQLIRLARKQFNLRLARRLLLQTTVEQTSRSGKTIDSNVQRRFLYEGILLDFAEQNHSDAMVKMWDFVREFMSSGSVSGPKESDNALNAKACLKLSSWLQNKPSQVSTKNLLSKLSPDMSHTQNFEAFHTGKEEVGTFTPEKHINGKYSFILQEVVGAGRKAATILCPDMAKAWFQYATWCYDHAKKFLSGSSAFQKPSIFGQLLEPELHETAENFTSATLYAVVSDAVSVHGYKMTDEGVGENGMAGPFDALAKKDITGVLDAVVQRLTFVMQKAAEAAGVEESDGESPATLLSTQLHKELQPISSFLGSLGEAQVVDQLMDLWWKLRRKKVALFGHAAQGFLHYLSMSSRQHGTLNYSNKSQFERVRLKNADGVISASFYVLRILLNYGVELEETLARGLSSVPPAPWQALTAQLFSRLSSHPEANVRKQLEALVMSLAHVSPWAIIYPTLVDINATDGQPAEELRRILTSLVNLHPRLVKDVQMMIAELAGITVLWDEQWLSTLQDLHADVMRRIATLKDEAARVAENPTLSQAEKQRINASKYTAIMAPVAVALERRLSATSRPPETPHEVWFQEQFGAELKAAISAFKSPPSGSASLGDAWRILDAIAASFGSHQKKSSTLLSNISPKLASFRLSEAPMPGLEVQIANLEQGVSKGAIDSGQSMDTKGFSTMVTIAGFEEQVAILATKTKPKKIAMVGSDGERYTYLLKGREDLRLDARIMQILNAVNGMMRANSATRQRCLAVRNYSVTPISGRAGLIQWVGNLTSMYSVFKAWQQRVQAAQMASNTADLINPSAVPRPSDLFYGKIIPALKEKGLRKVMSRRDWPHEVKRKVLLELMKETPRQLLHRELWCASSGLHDFKAKQERFSGSVAVMSMVGYVLGLGDRHLDNVLVDFNTGDVVHIDYNVCFDKGLRLKIPEIVPFRLTQTIQAALGVTGVEGLFRANCEAVLKVLQDRKDLILMLLEVFVWDPLVEWMRGDGHDEATIGGEERKGMEVAVSLSLLASRIQEIRIPLQEHHDQLLMTLPAVSQALQSWTDARARYEQAVSISGQLELKRLSASKTEAAARALTSESSVALEKARIKHEGLVHEFSQVKGQLSEAALEMTQWVDRQSRVLNALRNGSASEIQAIGKASSPVEGLSLTAAVLSARVPLTIIPEPAQIHCRDIDREVTQLVTTRYEALSLASRTLQAYATALQRLLPANYIAGSDGNIWAQILQVLARKLSPEVLAAAGRQAAELAARGRGDHDDMIRQKYETVRAHVEQLRTEVRKLQATCSELEASIDFDAEKSAKDRLITIFSRHLGAKGKPKKEDDFMSTAVNHSKVEEGREKDTLPPLESDDKRAKVMIVLHGAVSALFGEICGNVASITSERKENGSISSRWCLSELQKEVERLVLVSELLTELHQLGNPLPDGLVQVAEWAKTFRACTTGVQDFDNQLWGLILPEVLKAYLSNDPTVIEAFAALSRVRLSVDTALEQVAVIEAQRSSLSDLEKSYPEKVDQISKRQAELEDDAARSREHLSWEEAEELANEEEACRGVLEELHRAWAQRSSQASAIARSEMNVQAALVSAEQRFENLVSFDPDGDLHLMRGKVLLAAFARLFAALEPLDRLLTSFVRDQPDLDEDCLTYAELSSSGYPKFKSLWKAPDVNYSKVFFVWKVRVMDTLLTSFVNIASLNESLSSSLEPILSLQKQRLETQVQEFLDCYLRERVGSVLLNCLAIQKQIWRPSSTEGEAKKEDEPVKRVLRFIHEYCDAHENVRSIQSTVSILNSQIEELMQSLHQAHMEAAQVEWVHDSALTRSLPQSQLLGLPSSLSGEPSGGNMAWWSRRQVLDHLQSSISAITIANDNLQAFEAAGRSAEEQLERAMAWACATPSSSSGSSRNNGIPPEFHEHLRRRRQLLWSGQEQATGIIQLCAAVLEFEGSRGILNSPFQTELTLGSLHAGSPWQNTSQNLITRLEGAWLSFTSSESELQDTQQRLEALATHLRKASDELRIAARDVETALRELQAAKADLRDLTIRAGAVVSAFCRVMHSHSALTVESGTMIEEVLAITTGAEGVEDVLGLAQDAFSEHKQLMVDLTKINLVLHPIESILSSAASTLSLAVSRGEDLEADSKQGSQSHSQAVLQTLLKNMPETVSMVAATIPELIIYVKRLHMSLTKLARTATSDAGVLHKALEGVGESQEARSQEVGGVGSEYAMDEVALSEVQTDTSIDEGEGGEAISVASQSDELYLRNVDGFLSTSETHLGIEAFHPDEKGAYQLQMEAASQGLSTHMGASSQGSSSGKNALSFRNVVGSGGANASSAAERSEKVSNSVTAFDVDEYRTSSAVSNVSDGIDGDSQSEKSVQRERFRRLKLNSAAMSTQALSVPGHARIEQQVSTGLNQSKPEHTLRTKTARVLQTSEPEHRHIKEKNPYALSVLKRVRTKLEGRDVNGSRLVPVTEHVDYLLRQATSLDNLCNMYEGWTPWI